ncbi:MAG: hypothetical protein K6D96_01655 [Acetatifactor sp.]|nr:hypothetical protein [Acetatifactor sp.]
MSNPNQFLQGLMSNNQIANNPMARNAIQMMQNKDEKGLEQMARNLCKERGVDVDKLVQQFRNQLGL